MNTTESMFTQFNPINFHPICDELAVRDEDLKKIIDQYGYPPMWTRPNNFETLVHIILEQQVSLASALASLNKLRERIMDITPQGVLALTDEELKSCYFSRQKTAYVRSLAEAIQGKTVDLAALETLSNEEVRQQLNKLKGIGNWTIDIYLMMALQRTDVFPIGDLAVIKAILQIKQLPPTTSKETLIKMTSLWQPYQTVATMILWHFYLSVRIKKTTLQN